jgi:hypothetical protein
MIVLGLWWGDIHASHPRPPLQSPCSLSRRGTDRGCNAMRPCQGLIHPVIPATHDIRCLHWLEDTPIIFPLTFIALIGTHCCSRRRLVAAPRLSSSIKPPRIQATMPTVIP